MGGKARWFIFFVNFHSCCSLNVLLVYGFAHFYPHKLNKKIIIIKAELYECLLSVENDLGADKCLRLPVLQLFGL